MREKWRDFLTEDISFESYGMYLKRCIFFQSGFFLIPYTLSVGQEI